MNWGVNRGVNEGVNEGVNDGVNWGVNEGVNYDFINLMENKTDVDANDFNFGTFFFDPTTGYKYTNATVNGTSVDVDENGDLQLIELPLDSPVFISRESYNDVVNNTIQNMTDALVQNITDKVAENVNATFTEAINANLNELADSLSDQDVIGEINLLQRDIGDYIEDLKKHVNFTLELEAVVPEQILKDQTKKINKRSFDFISAVRRKLKGVDNRKVEKAIQGSFDKMERNIGRYGDKIKSLYNNIPPFPQELVKKIKSKAEDMVKFDLKDLKEFVEGKSNELEDSLLQRAEQKLNESKEYRLKTTLERVLNKDTSDLSQLLTQQVDDKTDTIGQAYEDIVEILLTPPKTMSELEIEGLEAITQTCIEKGITPWESTDVAIVATEKDGNEFKAAPHLIYDEFMYYVKLFASGAVAVGVGVGVGVRRFMVRPEVAKVITEALIWYPGGRGGGGQWRRR